MLYAMVKKEELVGDISVCFKTEDISEHINNVTYWKK